MGPYWLSHMVTSATAGPVSGLTRRRVEVLGRPQVGEPRLGRGWWQVDRYVALVGAGGDQAGGEVPSRPTTTAARGSLRAESPGGRSPWRPVRPTRR